MTNKLIVQRLRILAESRILNDDVVELLDEAANRICELPSKRTFSIEFTRWDQEKNDFTFDETQFDTEAEGTCEIMNDLSRLFSDFCLENNFDEAWIEHVYEVEYDGE